MSLVREAAKKVIFLMAGPLRGGGGKWPAIKAKITFLKTFFKILLPFKEKTFVFFFGFPKPYNIKIGVYCNGFKSLYITITTTFLVNFILNWSKTLKNNW